MPFVFPPLWWQSLLIGFVFWFGSASYAQESKIYSLDSNCHIRVVVQNPEGPAKADLLFLIGFADRADNHQPLFKQLSQGGVRVISFDYPEHGESQCGSLNDQTFRKLATMAKEIEELTRVDKQRPFILAGWSTGGLLAVRIAQNRHWGERKISGLTLLAPGLSVYNLIGEWGFVTTRSLLSNPNPPHLGEIKPISPLKFPKFSSFLLLNAQFARDQDFPKDLPTLVLVAGDEADVYAKSPVVRDWAKSLNGPIYGFQCPDSKHEMDNEIEPIGSEVRNLFSSFVFSPNDPKFPNTKSCHRFTQLPKESL